MPRIKEFRDKYLKQDLADYLFTERRRQKISQEQMARELGVKQPTYSTKEKNADFKFSELLILFRVLKTPADKKLALLGGRE